MLSVIIPTLNEEKYLPRLLNCLRNQTYKDFEVIVADAGSKDRTRDVAKAFGARVVEGGIPGVARNNGAKVAKGDILVFIDADVTFGNTFFEESIKSFKKKELDFAIPYFKTEHNQLRFKIFLRHSNIHKFLWQFTRFPDGTGQLQIAKRKNFEEIGGFPEYKVGEDTQLFWRAAKKKYRVGMVKTRFTSSTRRLEKMGISWTMLVWFVAGILMFFGLLHREKIQTFLSTLYGGLKIEDHKRFLKRWF